MTIMSSDFLSTSPALTLSTFLEVARKSPPDAVLTVEGNDLKVCGEGSLGHRNVAWVNGPALAVRHFRDALTREVSTFASQKITACHGLAGDSGTLRGDAVDRLVTEARLIQRQHDIELVLQGVADAERFRALGNRQSD